MIKVRREGEDLVVNLFQVNKLNTLFVDIVEEHLADILYLEPGKLYFDLSRIIFIDSSGFDMILRMTEKASEYNSEFILCNISDEVEELVNLLGIGDKLQVEHRQFNAESLILEVE